MREVDLECNGKVIKGDVLEGHDRYLKVAVRGQPIAIKMYRTDVRKPYVGKMAGLEITTRG